jgi:hypothetical protein
VRRTFIAINSYAKRTERGENILLDESDGYAIVARRIAVHHQLFEGGCTNKRVNWKTTSIPTGRTPFITTLSTIQEIAQIYLKQVRPDIVKKWKPPKAGMVPVRPAESSIESAYLILSELFDCIRRLPIFTRLEKADRDDSIELLEKWREFPRYSRTGASVEGTRSFRGHLLLRPVGQVILANAIAIMVTPRAKGGMGLSLDTVRRRLCVCDAADAFEAHRPSSIWYGVTYAPDTNRIINRNRSWAHRLLVHALAGTSDGTLRQELWWSWVSARIVDKKAMTWKNLQGRTARFSWECEELPSFPRR